MWWILGCAEPLPADEPWAWDLPEGWDAPVVPAANPMTVGKVELGEALFADRRLSANGTQSCSDCHDPAFAFTDGKARAVGSTGIVNRRGAMSLVNSAYYTAYTWADDTVLTLEEQALLPLLGTDPVEMAWADPDLSDLLPLYARVWPDGEITLDRTIQALASYERSLVGGQWPIAATPGQDLFNSERLFCYRCHGGYAFSESVQHTTGDELLYRNNGLYDEDGAGAYPVEDQGLIEVTGDPLDMGRFRAPTLRNIALTAPYMHDGSLATLDAVIDHYAAGGVGSTLQDPLVMGFTLTDEERGELVDFLESLTD